MIELFQSKEKYILLLNEINWFLPLDQALANLTEIEFIIATDGSADEGIATFS